MLTYLFYPLSKPVIPGRMGYKFTIIRLKLFYSTCFYFVFAGVNSILRDDCMNVGLGIYGEYVYF